MPYIHLVSLWVCTVLSNSMQHLLTAFSLSLAWGLGSCWSGRAKSEMWRPHLKATHPQKLWKSQPHLEGAHSHPPTHFYHSPSQSLNHWKKACTNEGQVLVNYMRGLSGLHIYLRCILRTKGMNVLFCGMALHHDMLPHSYLYFDSMTALESGARSGVCECCCESCSLQYM